MSDREMDELRRRIRELEQVIAAMPTRWPRPTVSVTGVKRFRLSNLSNEFANYSTCQGDPDGTLDGVNVNIAKPVQFRGYTTPKLYGTSGTPNVGQNISIWAVEPSGGTGVTATDGSAVTWLDISTAFPVVIVSSGNFYKVLGIDGNGRPIWDYVRAHN